MSEYNYTAKDYSLTSSSEILLTSECGKKLAQDNNVEFQDREYTGPVVDVRPDLIKQTLFGIGTSFTESSAFVLAHLEEKKRNEVMRSIYSEDGANFSLARTPIGSCDFCIEGKYSYDDVTDDAELKYFSIMPDKDGFSAVKHQGVKDEKYDLLPMIKQAIEIKNNQREPDLKIVASAWTAPSWMKDIDDWYISGTGGILKNQYVGTYADYLVRYITAYQQEGVNIWGITPVNEPLGNGGQWESMHFTPKTQQEFIKNHLGPKLKVIKDYEIKLFIFDQNRDRLEQWINVIYSDKNCARYVDGAAVHWYESTNSVNEDVFENVHGKYPDYSILHTEGCIDAIGNGDHNVESECNITDLPVWFNNDSFWWNKNATDWAYGLNQANVNPEDHPKYTPVHRYARNIIVSLNHWVNGWIDWNIVLDHRGGPNHVDNYCGSPIMIDISKQQIYYTPIYYVLSQFSRTIRPGDKALHTDVCLDGLNQDSMHASASINKNGLISIQVLNTTKHEIDYGLKIGRQYAQVSIAKNALQTIRVQLPESN